MEDMSANTTHASTSEKIEPSKLVDQFSELCRDIMAETYHVKSSIFLGSVKRKLKDIRNFKYGIMHQHDICFHANISYKHAAVRCAYLYAYGILNTIIVYFEFLKYLDRKQKVFLNKFSTKSLKICCLAGGPGTEALAVSKAIGDFFHKNSTQTQVDLFTDVEITVVDIIPEWKSEGESMIKSLNRYSNMFESKKVNFRYSFFKADLFSPLEEILKGKIAEADVITVVKFGSSIEERSKSSSFIEQLEITVKNIVDCMKGDSCLFMLDLAGGGTFKKLTQVVSTHQKSMFLKSSHRTYCLLPKTLQKIEAYINFQNFAQTSHLLPTKVTTISSCFFIKKTAAVAEKKKTKASVKTHKNTAKRDNMIGLPTLSKN